MAKVPRVQRPDLGRKRRRDADLPLVRGVVSPGKHEASVTPHRGKVYVDDAFTGGSWGRWTGGGHLQADDLDTLHAFAARLGLRREWFQDRPDRPERAHYDVMRSKRDKAILLGAIPETVEDGTRRRRAAREARRASA